MGSIFRQKNSKNLWIKYYRNGRAFRESSGSTKEGDAKRLLRLREGDIERGLPVTPKMGRLRFDEAAEDVLNDYRTNAKRSLEVVQRRIVKHLLPFFGGSRMSAITTIEIRKFIAKRQADTVLVRKECRIRQGSEWLIVPEVRRQVSNAEINRELTVLKRAFSLAIQAGKLMLKPHIPMLKENNVRIGFFEKNQFDAVAARLSAPVRAVVQFAYITGWRIHSEVLPLQWRQVDFESGEIRLDAGTTKNNEGRVFPMTAALRGLLLEQRDERDRLLRERGSICPSVFHRNGVPIAAFTKSWKTACINAGCPGRIPHDLRRTAVRNLVRAGIPERVAMKMTGHKTRSVFERYNIVSDGDYVDAVRRLDECHGHSLGIARAVGDDLAVRLSGFAEEKLEAPPGFEPGMEVLQTSALPLGDGAPRRAMDECIARPWSPPARGLPTGCPPPRQRRFGAALRRSAPSNSARGGEWSGKRDSNPRLRPWQGRTLPLSYSRAQTPNRIRPNAGVATAVVVHWR
jgi:integrase